MEITICADGELARLDGALAVAYHGALARVGPDPKLREALERAHAGFLSRREDALDWPGAGLAPFLRSWLGWLEAIGGPARAGWQGAWIAAAGSVEIRPRPAGGYAVVAKGDEPIRGTYTCEFLGVGRLAGDRIVVAWDTTNDEEDGAEGWTLVLRREGVFVALAQRRNASEAATAPFCGAHGSLEGRYLPARTLPTPVSAARTQDGAGAPARGGRR